MEVELIKECPSVDHYLDLIVFGQCLRCQRVWGLDNAKPMNKYIIYIKSHNGDAYVPDYEDSVKASDVNEAAKLLWEGMGKYGQSQWTPDDLIKYIAIENERE